MKTLTDLFDHSCCINLDRRTDRWKECISEFSKWDLTNVYRVSAVDKNNLSIEFPNINLQSGSKGALALLLTTLNILKYALKNKYDNILIMEDDVYFTPKINNIESLITYVPPNWDMLYIGGNHNYHSKGHRAQPIPINDHVLKCQHTFTTHCYAVKSHMYSILIDQLSTLISPIDVIYANIQKSYNVYSIHPSIAKQREGFSDVEGTVRNYDAWIV